jgi:hypothetical protein
MSQWWTYTLSDFLLFSPRTYYRLFELYNAALWPAHLLVPVLGAAILALLRTGGRGRSRIVSLLLAGCWLWVAWGFLYDRYATINWAATYFAGLFALQALLLALVGGLGGKLDFVAPAGGQRWAGLLLFLFALLVLPLAGLLLGRGWSGIELFALAPDPTALATLGLLLLASGPARWALMTIPVLWCAASGATLWAMGAPDAAVLPGAAALALAIASAGTLARRRGPAQPEEETG